MAISQVSVVIPTLNRVHTLRRAIDSVISQTYKAHSIVVIDDGSTDGTSEMINEYYPQIIFIKQDNQGVSAARNTGINSIDAYLKVADEKFLFLYLGILILIYSYFILLNSNKILFETNPLYFYPHEQINTQPEGLGIPPDITEEDFKRILNDFSGF